MGGVFTVHYFHNFIFKKSVVPLHMRRPLLFTGPERGTALSQSLNDSVTSLLSAELHTHTHTWIYKLTPWARVPLEKLTVAQLIKKLATFYGTRRFITIFTLALY